MVGGGSGSTGAVAGGGSVVAEAAEWHLLELVAVAEAATIN